MRPRRTSAAGFYELAVDAPATQKVSAAFTELARAI
jgi:hypothetical protein